MAKRGEVKLRIDEDDKRLLKEKSDRYGLSISEMIRRSIFEDLSILDKRSKFTDEQFKAVMSELGKLSEELGQVEKQFLKIGINFNQIAYNLNKSGNYDESELMTKIDNLGYILGGIESSLDKISVDIWKGIL